MIVSALKSKIHRATVTKADINYVGSISIDKNLIRAANLFPYEKVQTLNITNGNRLETYVIEAPEDSGEMCINGAAAHLIKPEDLVIIVSYCNIKHSDLPNHCPTVVYVNEKNAVLKVSDAILVE